MIRESKAMNRGILHGVYALVAELESGSAGKNLDTGLISCMHCGKFGKVFMVEVSGSLLISMSH